MIERQFVNQKIKAFQIQEYLKAQLRKTGYSHTEIKRTPLGEKVLIYTTRPGLVVGKKGENIKKLTNVLKKRFKLENPQIEIAEIEEPNLDVYHIGDRIISTLERFGSKRFKSTGYKTLQDILNAGALGAEITISGKVPSKRAKTWRFSAGYLKKSGDISENLIKKAYVFAKLKTGIIGVQVKIMTPDIVLPDKIELKDISPILEEIKIDTQKQKKETKKELKEETKKELKKETKKELKKETKKELKKETKKELKKETKKGIKKETKKEIKKETTDGNNKKE